MNKNAGPFVAVGNKRGPPADGLSGDEMCHLFFFRCFGVAVSHERSEDRTMKEKSFAVDAFASDTRITEIGMKYGSFVRCIANSQSSIVGEATNEV